MPARRRPDVRPLLAQLRCVAGRSFTVEELHGGLTNRNLKLTVGPDTFVVRIASDHSELLFINRDDEHRNSVAAAQLGLGAPVIEYRPDLGVLVVGFVDAATCSRDDVAEPDRLERIITACRHLHRGPPFGNDFDMFRLQASFLSTVQRRGFRLPPRFVDYTAQMARIEVVLSASDEARVPCHNDLLAENILDDGGRIWLIDYEYSGNNDPCYELGNMWSESRLGLDRLEELITLYYGEFRPAQAARARLHGLISKCAWMLWASIQDALAESDFDFWTWGMEKYDRALAEFNDPQFERLLETAGETGGARPGRSSTIPGLRPEAR